MRISFHGAAGEVVGSCHLVEAGGRRILIDCGLFQGGQELPEANAAPFGFDASTVDVVLLTHAHLDHCGRLQLLLRRGFAGEIVCTAPTRDLARLVLLDSATLQEEDARRRQRRRQRHGEPEARPLYDALDVLDTCDRIGRLAELRRPIDLGNGVTASFHEAGHILGAASVLLEIPEDGRRRRVLFSGDIGPAERPLLNSADPPGDVEVVVMESTYGDRDHRDLAASVAEFLAAVRHTVPRGNVIVPTFALERAQELLCFLCRGQAEGKLGQGVRVYLDSPMAISATALFRRHAVALKPEVAAELGAGRDPFAPPGLELVHDAADSRALNRIEAGAVILAGSGMATGGRIRHPLRHHLGNPADAVVFAGFAAEGTPARQIIDGARAVRLHGHSVPVVARLHTINGFSAHAGRRDLIDWHARTGAPAVTFLVLGEEVARAALAPALSAHRVELPGPYQGFTL